MKPPLSQTSNVAFDDSKNPSTFVSRRNSLSRKTHQLSDVAEGEEADSEAFVLSRPDTFGHRRSVQSGVKDSNDRRETRVSSEFEYI